MKHLANFWRTGWVAKAVTVFVSIFAICCIGSSILLAIPTPASSIEVTTTQIPVTGETAQVLSPSPTLFTPTSAPTLPLSFSPTPSLVPLDAASILPTATIYAASLPITANQPFRIHFVNVGQGDAILIQTADEETILIDGGDTNTGIVGYLQSVGVQQIDLMVATHPHADHIGGLVQVLRAFPVLKVVTNGQAHTTSVYEDFLDAIAASHAEYIEVKRGDVLQAGKLKLNVLSPVATSEPDLNENSIVLRFTDGRTTYLLMGDAGVNTEAALLASGMPLGADVLKVGHHGSKSGSTPVFLNAVHPETAIISAGLDNPYGHPALQTIVALHQIDATIYVTSVNGTVLVKDTAKGYEVQPEKVELGAIPTATFRPVATNRPPSGLEIQSVTSPIARGGNARLVAQTSPGASCSITVFYKSGPSKAAGLDSKKADASGIVAWTWKVGTKTTPGTWPIWVSCDNNKIETEFTVQ